MVKPESDTAESDNNAYEQEPIATTVLHWTDAVSIGVPEIDADHQVLFGLMGRLAEVMTQPANDEAVAEILDALVDYGDYHMQREERVLEAVDFPDVARHKAGHAMFRKRVNRFLHQYEANAAEFDTLRVLEFLRRWLTTHVMKEDQLFATYCIGNAKVTEAVASMGSTVYLDAVD
jgi:hemerythrin-like metal-binding protein